MVTVGQLAFSETAENVFNLRKVLTQETAHILVRGLIITSKEVTLCPFEMQTMSSLSKVIGHVR